MWGIIITSTLNSKRATSEQWQKRAFFPLFCKDTEVWNGAGSCQGSRAPSPVISTLALVPCLQAALLSWERWCWQDPFSLQSLLSVFLGTVVYPGDIFRSARLESRNRELGTGSVFLSFIHKWWKCGVADGVEVDEELTSKSAFSLFSCRMGCFTLTLIGKTQKRWLSSWQQMH